MSGAEAAGALAEKVIRLLAEVPLCDRCLGRMFGLLGRGLGNDERGRVLKTFAVMALHERIRGGDEEARRLFHRLAPRLRPYSDRLYLELFGEEPPPPEPCYICGGKLDAGIERLASQAVSILRGLDVSGFLVAARVPPELREREDELKRLHGLAYAESIAAEVRREVSKRVQASTGLRPDFELPDVVLEADLSTWTMRALLMPVLLRGRYLKTARRVSQSIWVTRFWERRYPFSVEDAMAWLAEVMDAEDVVLHAAGREDADVRMLGSGRPFIVEVKHARRRGLPLELLSHEVNSRAQGFVRVSLEGRARRQEVAEVKGADSRHSKVYHAIVVVEDSVSVSELRRLEEFFSMREVRQRTPRRVRHRRPDVVRERLVFSVKTRQLGSRVFEALIHAEGGLYIKELVSGDGGDTTPSFSEVLGRQAVCASLDVVAVLPGAGERL